MYQRRHITVIIPALNEAPSIALVVRELLELKICSQCCNPLSFHSINSNSIQKECTRADGLPSRDAINVACMASVKDTFCSGDCSGTPMAVVDKIVVGDNGSTDNTAAIAIASGAMVMSEPERGYGAACLAALAAPLKKDIIVFVDADHSVVAQELPALLKPIINGADLVIGSRTRGHCEKNALTAPQIMGNRLATTLMRLLWREHVTDLGPFRAITQKALSELKMRDRRFGWTVEMQVKALQRSMNIVEVPVSTKRRIGRSKVSGTVKGVVGAAHGILGTIGALYWREKYGNQKSPIHKTLQSSKIHIKHKPEELS